MRENGIIGCVVNGTECGDWRDVSELAECHSGFVIPSFGLHPWKVKDRPDDWLNQLREYLMRFPNAGVGECGLDRWIENFDIDDQRDVFRDQLRLATELDRPCTIHCLRAWGLLLEDLNDADALPSILLHSYGGSIETAQKLVELGAYFSFSGYFLRERKRKVVDVFRQIPRDRILVETDAPDMIPPEHDRPFGDEALNHPANLARVEPRLVELLGIKSDQLVENTFRWLGRPGYTAP